LLFRFNTTLVMYLAAITVAGPAKIIVAKMISV